MYKKSQLRFITSSLFILMFSAVLIFSFAGGDGSLGDPYQITDCTDLQNMSFDLSANYTLVNDIDCSVTSSWNSGAGFNPIGNCTGISCTAGGDDFPFEGTLNGNNNKIQSLYINRPTRDYVGIFGFINYSNIFDLELTSVNISGKDYVGSIVGYNNYGVLNNTHSSGILTGQNNVGGLAGLGFYGEIYYSSFNGAVNGTGSWYAAGLVGYQFRGSVGSSFSSGSIYGVDLVGGLIGEFKHLDINNSYSICNVIGNNYVGGLIGYSDYGNIDNSYALGNVTGNDQVGGLVGRFYYTNLEYGYSIGNVAGSSNVGGLIGHYTPGSALNSYWNTETSGQGTSQGGAGVVGKTTSEMMQNSTYSGWDFTNTWNITEGSSYPFLIDVTSGGSEEGSESSPQSSSSSMASIFPAQGFISILISLFLILFFLK